VSAGDLGALVFPPMHPAVAVLVYPLTISIALVAGMMWAVVALAVLCWRGGWAFGGWAFDQWEAGRA